MKYLIVNADDFNLTRGTDRAILECHDKGIVSSTTVLMTLPFSPKTVRDLKARPFLGKGIHLSLTLGTAVSPKTPFQLTRNMLTVAHKIPVKAAEREYEAQILKFKKLTGRLPTHMDTHHHIHGLRNIQTAIGSLSRKFGIPFRRVNKAMPGATHYLFEDLDPKKHWTGSKFAQVLKELPSGISEIMVHPGYVDRDLKAISSFQSGREIERKILMAPKIRALLDPLNIKLINFSAIQYFSPLFKR